MELFDFKSYGTEGETPVQDSDIVFHETHNYANPLNGNETRQQLSTPLYQLKKYINSLFDNSGKIPLSNLNIPSASSQTSGLMASTDKNKLDGITTQYIANIVYPVGSLYLSVSSVSPSTLFGGTWEQITTDAYLKIVTSNAGTAGGTSSEHKIPNSSMPSHRHELQYLESVINVRTGTGLNRTLLEKSGLVEEPPFTGYDGGGLAYYPYYVGVYVWKRTA